MPIGAELRFRLLLGIAKQIIFAVDSLPWSIPLPYRRATQQPVSVPGIGHRISIAGSIGRLDAWLVEPDSPADAAVLLFHGIGDRLSYWRRAQHRLARAGISSLVFAYSGYPGSTGTTTPANLAEDAHAAYAWLRSRIPFGTPIFLLGFSLGSGLAAEVAAALQPPPAGLILAEAFTSLREAGRRIVGPLAFLGNLLPDVWQTRQNVRRIPFPVLVVHSTGDALFPIAMAEQIHCAGLAAGRTIELAVLHGHAHNAPYLTVPADYWAVIVRFISAHAGPPPPAS